MVCPGVCARTLASRLSTARRSSSSSPVPERPGAMSVCQARSGSVISARSAHSRDQGGDVHRLGVLPGLLVQAGQPEHVVDQGAHPLRLVRDAAHRLVDLVRLAQCALLVELGVGAQRGQRVAQLVAGVGEEAPGQFLAGLALADRRLDPGEHAVQRRAEAADLGPRILRADPLGEVAGGDLVGLAGHPLDRAQAAAQHQADAPGHQQPDGDRGDGQDQFQVVDGAVHVAEAGGGVEEAAWFPDGAEPERAAMVRADHGLGAVVSGEHAQQLARRDARDQAGVPADELTWALPADEPDPELHQDRCRDPEPRSGDHLLDARPPGRRPCPARSAVVRLAAPAGGARPLQCPGRPRRRRP